MWIGKNKEKEVGVNLEEKAKQVESKGKKIYSQRFFSSVALVIILLLFCFVFEAELNYVLQAELELTVSPRLAS